DRAGDGDHGAHRGEAIVDIRAFHGRAIEDGTRKTLDLSPVEMAVRAQNAVRRAIGFAENVDLAGLVIPGVIGLAENAAVLAVDLETLVPVHADLHGEIEMTERAG